MTPAPRRAAPDIAAMECISETFKKISDSVPDAELDKLPKDASSSFRDYLYGGKTSTAEMTETETLRQLREAGHQHFWVFISHGDFKSDQWQMVMHDKEEDQLWLCGDGDPGIWYSQDIWYSKYSDEYPAVPIIRPAPISAYNP